MNWIDIASIVFVCVTMNHLGLVKAIEDVSKTEIPILNCPKCSSFWLVLTYTVLTSHDIIASLAVSFLSGYAAIWLELIEGIIDALYNKVYDEIYPTDD